MKKSKKLNLPAKASLFPSYYLKQYAVIKRQGNKFYKSFNDKKVSFKEGFCFIRKNDHLHILNINCFSSLTSLESSLLKLREELKKTDTVFFYYIDQQWFFQNFLPIASTKLFQEKNELKINYEAKTSIIRIETNKRTSQNNKDQLELKLFSYEQIELALSKTGFIAKTVSDIHQLTFENDFIVTSLNNTVPEALAIGSYQSTSISKVKIKLDLRWSPDEKIYLDIDLNKMIATHLKNGLKNVNDLIATYRVYDPYGAKNISSKASAFFKKNINENMIALTAGVSSALFCLSKIITNTTAACTSYTYPDLPSWVTSSGNKLLKINLEKPLSELEREIIGKNIQLIILDNPNFLGKKYDKKFIVDLSKILNKNNGYLIVDESNANYLPASDSLVHILKKTNNVIICRGFSKGYCLGGLRAGLVLFSAELKGLIKRCLPILQTSELSLQLAGLILEAGDVFTNLRAKIKTHRKITERLLHKQGFNFLNTNIALPWILLKDNNGAIYRELLSRGIMTKPQKYFNHIDQPDEVFLRLCVPLGDERMRKFESCISGKTLKKTKRGTNG